VRPNRRVAGFLLVGLAILALGPIVQTHVVLGGAIQPLSIPTVSRCRDLGRWSSDWTPRFVSPDFQAAESFECDGYTLHINLVQYVGQRQGKEAVSDSNSVIPRNWWNNTTRARRTIGAGLEVDELRVLRPPRALTIWTWYAVGTRPASSDISVKALEAMNVMMLRASTTTNFTVAAESDIDFDATAALDRGAAAVWNNFNETAKGVTN
jgi:EpsI family protein